MAEVNGNRTHSQNTSSRKGLQQTAQPRGAESGAVGAQSAAVAALDLATVVDSWGFLPEPIKAGIVAMVRAATAR